MLMEFGADVAAIRTIAETPFHVAAKQNDHEAIRLLGGGVREISDANNEYPLYTSLHEATRCGNLAAIRVLVKELGADVDAANRKGWTAMHIAARSGLLNMFSAMSSVQTLAQRMRMARRRYTSPPNAGSTMLSAPW